MFLHINLLLLRLKWKKEGNKNNMRILVACEESQQVCYAFRQKGHEAYSCDLQVCSGGHPEWHIMGDVLLLLDGYCSFCTMDGVLHFVDSEWDMIIAFPPCTDLACSGARHFQKKIQDGRQQKSIEFFMEFTRARCEKIVIENPVGIMSRVYRKPDQIVHPWYFGDGYPKRTCLWFIGDVSLLVPVVLQKPDIEYYTWVVDGKQKRLSMWMYNTGLGSNSERGKRRSKTPPGLAAAMAKAWG